MDVILCFSSCWINYFSSLSVTRTNWCVQRRMSDGVGRRHTLLCVSASVFEGGVAGSKMSAPKQFPNINIQMPALKESRRIPPYWKQAVIKVYSMRSFKCVNVFWHRATNWGISVIVWFIVWPRKCRGTTDLSLRGCKVAKSNKFPQFFNLIMMIFFFLIDSINRRLFLPSSTTCHGRWTKSNLMPNAVFPFMFPQSKHSIRTNKMQLSSSNLFQFDFISRELNQARNQRGVWLWNT